MNSTRNAFRFSMLALVPAVALAAGCAATHPPHAAAESASTPASTASGDETQVCTLVCEQAKLVMHESPAQPDNSPDYTGQELASANRVLDAMHGDLLACYKTRVAVNPRAHGSITVDILIDAQGHVQSTETTGGAILGGATMRCIVGRIQRATFDPPHGGGTMHIQAPFSLRPVGSDDT